MTDKAELKTKIRAGLEELALTLDGSAEKVLLIVNTFIDETPDYFKSLRKVVAVQNKNEIQQQLHTLKARYGYFGLTGVMNEMDSWERALDEASNHSTNLERLRYFEELNEQIIEALRSSDYFKVNHRPENSDSSPLSGKRVLVAEDDEINAMVFELFIEELGGKALKAADGHEAVRQVTEHAPDFIFMDIHMPYFSGVEAIKLLRSKNILIPIVALSASTRLQEKQQSIDAGATDFLTKPAKRDVIREMLLKHLC